MEAAAEKSRSATVLDLQAWTYYNLYKTTSWGNLLSDLHIPDEQWALDRRSWCLFCLCLWVSVILPTCSLYPQQKRAYSALHPHAWTCIYSSMPVGTYRVQSLGFPKIVYSCKDSQRNRQGQVRSMEYKYNLQGVKYRPRYIYIYSDHNF